MLEFSDEGAIVYHNPLVEQKCKVKVIGADGYDLVECLMEHSVCEHVITFGYNLPLCRHPQRREIVENNLLLAGDS